MKTHTLKRTRIIFSVGSFLAALILFGIFLSPYGFLKTIGGHLSPDGNFKSFTPALYTSLRPPTLVTCLVFLLIGIGLFVFSSSAECGLLYIAHILRRCITDYKILFHDLGSLRLNWKESLLLVAIFILGLIPRIMLLNCPIEDGIQVNAVNRSDPTCVLAIVIGLTFTLLSLMILAVLAHRERRIGLNPLQNQ
jgi:hypothetical protein